MSDSITNDVGELYSACSLEELAAFDKRAMQVLDDERLVEMANGFMLDNKWPGRLPPYEFNNGRIACDPEAHPNQDAPRRVCSEKELKDMFSLMITSACNHDDETNMLMGTLAVNAARALGPRATAKICSMIGLNEKAAGLLGAGERASFAYPDFDKLKAWDVEIRAQGATRIFPDKEIKSEVLDNPDFETKDEKAAGFIDWARDKAGEACVQAGWDCDPSSWDIGEDDVDLDEEGPDGQSVFIPNFSASKRLEILAPDYESAINALNGKEHTLFPQTLPRMEGECEPLLCEDDVSVDAGECEDQSLDHKKEIFLEELGRPADCRAWTCGKAESEDLHHGR